MFTIGQTVKAHNAEGRTVTGTLKGRNEFGDYLVEWSQDMGATFGGARTYVGTFTNCEAA